MVSLITANSCKKLPLGRHSAVFWRWSNSLHKPIASDNYSSHSSLRRRPGRRRPHVEVAQEPPSSCTAGTQPPPLGAAPLGPRRRPVGRWGVLPPSPPTDERPAASEARSGATCDAAHPSTPTCGAPIVHTMNP
eukprot:scaffold1788_cov396-Prasinococcus_capsulatus_cf.AAC.7